VNSLNVTLNPDLVPAQRSSLSLSLFKVIHVEPWGVFRACDAATHGIWFRQHPPALHMSHLVMVLSWYQAMNTHKAAFILLWNCSQIA